MGKPRYFTVDKKEEEATKANVIKTKKKELVYNVKIKPNVWGRKQEHQVKRIPNPNPKYPGKPPIPKELLEKYSRGDGINKSGIKTNIHKKRQENKERNIQFSTEQAARVEILLTEDSGYLEADEGETTTQFTQKQIVDNVDITAATKSFDLKLMDFGPYCLKYTRNGRHLLLGGKKGHVAAFDWVTKKLHCEVNVMESVHDVSWLHVETMFAVAQKEWVYIYDNQGIELHCLNRLNKVTKMEFLPYHFLLATASDQGYLSWLDISIGELVTQYNTKLGRLTMLTQNPYNAVLCVGHAKGVVSMWSPNTRDPLAKMLCHKATMTALHIDPKGLYMATAATDRSLKIWDIRKLTGPLQSYNLRSAPTHVALSQKSLLAVGTGNVVEVYRDSCTSSVRTPYLRHRFNVGINSFSFCPYEDVLGVGTEWGFTSLLVPGAGEANFDALEANPYQTKKQRQESEVKALLEKIQPDLITLDPTSIAEVDVPTLKDKVEAKKKLLHVKPPKINYEPRRKGKGRNSSAKIFKNKKIVREVAKKEFIKNIKGATKKRKSYTKAKNKKSTSVLDRFLPKK
ncbi:hypothetical protein Trydic_g6123 [Trypoxylus dichotomus]